MPSSAGILPAVPEGALALGIATGTKG